jgi:hypothetical protein
MPTRKQRRRRAKEQRHEYDVVYVDSEGNEVEVEPEEEPERPRRKSEARTPRQDSGRGRARGRALEPPSWRRSLKRGLIFGPIFLAVVLLLNGGRQTLAASVFNTILLLIVFVPFSYLMDRVFWRSYQKRLAKSGREVTGNR